MSHAIQESKLVLALEDGRPPAVSRLAQLPHKSQSAR